MQFQKYASIENHYNGKFIDYIRMNHNLEAIKWIITEKIHGANYSIWSDGETAQAGKRSGFINASAGERFYAHEPVFDKYKDAVIALAKEVGPVAVYGELYGGNYPGFDSPTNVAQVQKEVKYCPYLDFAAFDIYAVDKGEFLGYTKFKTLTDIYEIPTVPMLGMYNSLSEALAYPNEFLTKVPYMHGLPDIEGNVCEGIVISPMEPLYLPQGSRVIIKSKNDKFKESAKQQIGSPKPSMLNDSTSAAIAVIRNNLTTNRMNNVVSKYGQDEPFVVLLQELVRDSIADGAEEVYNNLTEAEQNFVRKAITAEAAQLVKVAKYAA